jgi:hypothetical protein
MSTGTHTTVNVHVQPKVTVEALTHIISTIGGKYGCRTCGLMGVDLHLTGDAGDPYELANVEGIKKA